jgi:hypothetical protein
MAKNPDTPGTSRQPSRLVATTRIASASHCDRTMTCGCPRCQHDRHCHRARHAQRPAVPEFETGSHDAIAALMRSNRGTGL